MTQSVAFPRPHVAAVARTTDPEMTTARVGSLGALLAHESSPKVTKRRERDIDAHVAPAHFEQALFGPLGEFLSRPSKGIRERLVQAGYRLAGGQGAVPELACAIVESLHAGSLIVDDIQDQSASRRGGPALHVMHGVPKALNAGNWLYFWPSTKICELELPAERELMLHRTINQAVLDCHYGQALDLSLSVSHVSHDEMYDVVRATTALKTGSLVRLATLVGAIVAGADATHCRAIGRFGLEFGVTLQMLDDMSGLVNDERCHKGHEDLLNGRPSWIWAWLARHRDDLTFARLQRRQRQVEARDLHPEFVARELREALDGVMDDEITAHLSKASVELDAALPGSVDTQWLCAEFERLQRGFL